MIRSEKGRNKDTRRKDKGKNLLLPLVKTGKDIVKSVIFWCVAVSITVSGCYGARDLAVSVAEKIHRVQQVREKDAAGVRGNASGQADAAGVRGNASGQVASVDAYGDEAGKEPNAGQADAAGVRGNASGQTASVDAYGDEAGKKPDAGQAGQLQKETEKKTVALTFDDGPHPTYTKRLLDGLLARGVKATFFVIGRNIPGNEELITRMEEEGHLIGNHTYDHVQICGMDPKDACYQVEQTSALVREITGHDTEFVRPPFGAWNPDLECSFVMVPVLWDVDPLDWTTSNTSLVVQRVIEDVEDQDIVLLHDVYESSVEAALQIVDILKKEGYEFVTADKLILD